MTSDADFSSSWRHSTWACSYSETTFTVRHLKFNLVEDSDVIRRAATFSSSAYVVENGRRKWEIPKDYKIIQFQRDLAGVINNVSIHTELGENALKSWSQSHLLSLSLEQLHHKFGQ